MRSSCGPCGRVSNGCCLSRAKWHCYTILGRTPRLVVESTKYVSLTQTLIFLCQMVVGIIRAHNLKEVPYRQQPTDQKAKQHNLTPTANRQKNMFLLLWRLLSSGRTISSKERSTVSLLWNYKVTKRRLKLSPQHGTLTRETPLCFSTQTESQRLFKRKHDCSITLTTCLLS